MKKKEWRCTTRNGMCGAMRCTAQGTLKTKERNPPSEFETIYHYHLHLSWKLKFAYFTLKSYIILWFIVTMEICFGWMVGWWLAGWLGWIGWWTSAFSPKYHIDSDKRKIDVVFSNCYCLLVSAIPMVIRHRQPFSYGF